MFCLRETRLGISSVFAEADPEEKKTCNNAAAARVCLVLESVGEAAPRAPVPLRDSPWKGPEKPKREFWNIPGCESLAFMAPPRKKQSAETQDTKARVLPETAASEPLPQ
jgi:hypothetical protein